MDIVLEQNNTRADNLRTKNIDSLIVIINMLILKKLDAKHIIFIISCIIFFTIKY
jgi:hypothetical protein